MSDNNPEFIALIQSAILKSLHENRKHFELLTNLVGSTPDKSSTIEFIRMLSQCEITKNQLIFNYIESTASMSNSNELLQGLKNMYEIVKHQSLYMPLDLILMRDSPEMLCSKAFLVREVCRFFGLNEQELRAKLDAPTEKSDLADALKMLKESLEKIV